MQILDKLSPAQRAELHKGVIEVSGEAMNRTALGIVDALLTLYPDLTFDALKRMLPDTINPSAPRNYKSLFQPHTNRLYGVVQPGSIRALCAQQGLDIGASHFTGDGETFKTADGVEVLVSKSWESADTITGEHDLQKLIDHVAPLGVRVVRFERKKAFKKGGYNLDVVQPALLQAMQKRSGKAYWSWLIGLLTLLLAVLFILFIKKEDKQEGTVQPTGYMHNIALPIDKPIHTTIL